MSAIAADKGMSAITYTRRKWTNTIMLGLCSLSAFLAIGILALILGLIVVKGIHYINLDFFTKPPRPVGESGGGVSNAIVGSLLIVGVAALIGIPFGVGTGVFLAETAGPRMAGVVRFTADVLTGVPSIVVGILVYSWIVLRMGHFSAFAAAIALAIIMVPIMARSSEEMLKLVPQSQREAALALGVTRWRTILSIVIPAARRGLITGGLLAIARAAGETAPLLFTSLGNLFPTVDFFGKPMAALPVDIYQYATGPYQSQHEQAFAAAFVLVAVVFFISLVSRLLLSRQG
ncbi:MAG: phosphate ABC transporter permease PstA [Dehalococcoidia bacterium]|jgi:phosphate transport system permease protein